MGALERAFVGSGMNLRISFLAKLSLRQVSISAPAITRLTGSNPPRPKLLRRSECRLRCNRESSWHRPIANSRPLVRYDDIFAV
jgi:hypothetical protein